jgi:hypothetical protein
VREIADEEVKVTVLVEIAPAGADRMAAVIIQGALPGDASGCRHIRESAVPVVEPQVVLTQAVAGDIDVQVAVLIEIAGRGAARARLLVVAFRTVMEKRAPALFIRIASGNPDGSL